MEQRALATYTPLICISVKYYLFSETVLKSELLIPWVELAKTALMHSELHVGFYLKLSMNYEHNIVDHVGDEELETQVDQGYDIGDGVFTKPHTIVVAIYCFLVGHFHRATIALQSHYSFRLICLLQ